MLTVVKSYLRLIGLYFKFNLSAVMEYRISFFTQAIGMAINDAFLVLFWGALFSKFKTVAGYSLQDMMFLWAVATASFGFAFIFFGNTWHLGKFIIEGNLDSYMLQPKNVYLNVILSRSMVGAWGDITFGCILFVLFYGFNLEKLAMFAVFIVLGAGLVIASMTVMGSLAFFMGNANAMGDLMVGFLTQLTTYPENMYKGWVRYIIYSVVPAGFIVFIPLKIIKSFSWSDFGILFIVDILYMLGAYSLFRYGLRKYESGNLITTKL